MDFNEYWKNGCFGEYHDIYAKNLADKFYQAGQQSKQAEIDAMKQQNQRLAMRLDVIQGVLQKQIDLIVELKNDT